MGLKIHQVAREHWQFGPQCTLYLDDTFGMLHKSEAWTKTRWSYYKPAFAATCDHLTKSSLSKYAHLGSMQRESFTNKLALDINMGCQQILPRAGTSTLGKVFFCLKIIHIGYFTANYLMDLRLLMTNRAQWIWMIFCVGKRSSFLGCLVTCF